jgi:hypothetical protein
MEHDFPKHVDAEANGLVWRLDMAITNQASLFLLKTGWGTWIRSAIKDAQVADRLRPPFTPRSADR